MSQIPVKHFPTVHENGILVNHEFPDLNLDDSPLGISNRSYHHYHRRPQGHRVTFACPEEDPFVDHKTDSMESSTSKQQNTGNGPRSLDDLIKSMKVTCSDSTNDIPEIDDIDSIDDIDLDDVSLGRNPRLADRKYGDNLPSSSHLHTTQYPQFPQTTNQLIHTPNLHNHDVTDQLESANQRWPLIPIAGSNETYDAVIEDSVKKCEDLQHSLDRYIAVISPTSSPMATAKANNVLK